MTYLWLVLGGTAGTLARYAVSNWMADRWPSLFPFGTLAVNISGSFLLGLVATLGATRGILPPPARLALGTGFCGAYTTFSTWSVETLKLLEQGRWLMAGLNVAGSLVAGLLAAWLGMAAGRSL